MALCQMKISQNVMAAPVNATFAYYIGLVINDKVGAIVELVNMWTRLCAMKC